MINPTNASTSSTIIAAPPATYLVTYSSYREQLEYSAVLAYEIIGSERKFITHTPDEDCYVEDLVFDTSTSVGLMDVSGQILCGVRLFPDALAFVEFAKGLETLSTTKRTIA